MASTSTDRSRPDKQAFMEIGQHCQEESCNQLDFLPFKCGCCAQMFCQEHWRTSAHACPKYNATLADNRVPMCPVCSAPVSFPLGQDPNFAMDRHLSESCAVLNEALGVSEAPRSSRTARGAPTCDAARCKSKLVAPITCKACAGSFCAAHRMPREHACDSRSAAHKKTNAALGGGGPGAGGLRSGKSISATGLAALRRAQQVAASKPSSKPIPSSDLPASGQPLRGTPANPIVIDDSDSDADALAGRKKAMVISKLGLSKSDRRATAEQESARKALEARAKKGLLTDDEKVRVATERAQKARKRNKDDKCHVA